MRRPFAPGLLVVSLLALSFGLRAQQTGSRPNLQDLKVRLRYSDGTEYGQTGTLNFVDVSVDRGTDVEHSDDRSPVMERRRPG